ncbi:MAG: ATP-binding protein [Bacteroidetes bacterium HGW-Bacteroidetes-17]|nr:MAG: ATP-binding protein [Bacteroidetes bacterium HGW-Bacteroidetes-17]
MIFNRFNLSIILQVVLIGLNTSLFIWTYSMEYMLITRYSLILLWFIQIIFLIRYVQKTNRELNRFLQSIKYNDSTIKFNKDTKSPFNELYQSFEEVVNAFGKIKAEKESEYQFFQATIQHIGVGIIAFDENGHIHLCNKAANELLGLPVFINIEALNKIKSGFDETLKKLKPNTPELIKLKIGHDLKQLSFHATNFKIDKKPIILVSIQNIRNEIEQGEMEAWQGLIRVMTHEILNSVSPITLLSSGLINNIERNKNQSSGFGKENFKDLLQGLKVIQSRSKGLSSFVEDYRSSMQIPAPQFKELKISQLFETMETLFAEELKQKNIQFKAFGENDLKIIADQKLIEQVLINLINNSIYFTSKTEPAEIILSAKLKEQNTIITVTDNGQGIDDEIMDQIFIPFFSTKEKGSGIGLSLSRQIMRLHKGTISVESKKDVGSTFTLKF